MLETQLQLLLDSEHDPLRPWRKKYWEHFRDIGSFEEKKEALRYLRLKELKFPKPAQNRIDFEKALHKRSNRLVFIDGFFAAKLSHVPESVICLSMDEALNSYGVFLHNRMNKALKEENDPFAALNGVFQGIGAFVYVPPNTHIETPISIDYLSQSTDMATPRIIIYAGRGSSFSLRQCFAQESFINSHIDLILDEGAQISLKSEQKENNGHFFQAFRASLKKNSNLSARIFMEGAKIARHSCKVQLLEEGADALLQGLIIGKQNFQSHIHTTMEHLAAYTKSYQHFKALLKDGSISSFEGKIYVHPEAQKTDSYQLNNYLLLSPNAKAYSKPNLEIFADDVKASHGATISQLDEESLFYLKSRGLDTEQAKKLLIDSFVKELSHCLPQEEEIE